MDPRAEPRRFQLVDAFRGIASLMVVFYHVYQKNLLTAAESSLPFPFHHVFIEGHLGVQIFFVLSGFVIAHSVHRSKITPGFVGRFALRRAVRLDPPYWAAIVGMCLLTLLSRWVLREGQAELPTIGSVLAHLIYAQGFLGYPHIVGVFWTLCYEVQFYLAYVILFGVARSTNLRLSRWLIFLPLWLLSLATACELIDISNALALRAWPYFFLGVLTYWHFASEIPALVVWIAAVVTALCVGFDNPLGAIAGIGTALGLHLASKSDAIYRFSLGRFTQFLGRVSYSLYLIHMVVGTRVARVFMKLFGPTLSWSEMIVAISISVGVSIAAAFLFYLAIERPSQRLSRRMGSVEAS